MSFKQAKKNCIQRIEHQIEILFGYPEVNILSQIERIRKNEKASGDVKKVNDANNNDVIIIEDNLDSKRMLFKKLHLLSEHKELFKLRIRNEINFEFDYLGTQFDLNSICEDDDAPIEKQFAAKKMFLNPPVRVKKTKKLTSPQKAIKIETVKIDEIKITENFDDKNDYSEFDMIDSDDEEPDNEQNISKESPTSDLKDKLSAKASNEQVENQNQKLTANSDQLESQDKELPLADQELAPSGIKCTSNSPGASKKRQLEQNSELIYETTSEIYQIKDYYCSEIGCALFYSDWFPFIRHRREAHQVNEFICHSMECSDSFHTRYVNIYRFDTFNCFVDELFIHET